MEGIPIRLCAVLWSTKMEVNMERYKI